ncbi:MAG: 2-C-methyl-D-erythritol 2,4-cyclodiphosphate synthase [Persephonella sp.]|nr:MAG: 2-C-methyl-D-erythritol 2,4-cyclodiphosphate synthase [Persephonella sp.]RUM62084.1 MAG: 2-C-methyl-D-erythritol 2,4-cyclodiphosphate synthase [Persephonella sp.]
MFRIGIGFDLHRLEEGKKLIIGGVIIPYEKGFIAHSDGDILFHSITDALLGAVGYGDIGELFPDNDNRWKDADSSTFLKEAKRIVDSLGYEIVNIDSVIILQKPKIKPYRELIRENTAKVLEIEKSKVFIKGKTYEKIGDLGKGLAGECRTVALLKRKDV